MDRVVSKNLFNFPLSGEMDPEVIALEGMITDEQRQAREKMVELAQHSDPESSAAFVHGFRATADVMIRTLSQSEVFAHGAEGTSTSHLRVPTAHDGEYEVEVEVYTPTSLGGKRAAIIYAHGGGVIAISAGDVRAPLQCLALEASAVVFNVDYRLAPETKCPNNIMDFYEVIKYVSSNAESLGIDADKIVVSGESGGGYIVLGALVLLAERGEGNLVKLAMPSVPMVDDYCFSDPLCMTKEEREASSTMRKIWRDLIAADFETQKTSPYLFPGKASDDLLAKFPPTIIIEMEFDMFITEATRLANRLRRAGRLLELVVIPGNVHVSAFLPKTRGRGMLNEVFKKIAENYIHA